MEYEAPMQRRPSVTRSRSIFDRRPSDRSNAPSMDRRHSLHKHRKGPSPQALGIPGSGPKVCGSYMFLQHPEKKLGNLPSPSKIVWKSKGCHNSSGGSFPKTYFEKLVLYWLATNGNKSPCKIRLSLNCSQVGNALLIWFQPKFGGGIGVAERHCRWLGMCLAYTSLKNYCMLGVEHVGICRVLVTLIHSWIARTSPGTEWMMSITLAWNSFVWKVFDDRNRTNTWP